MDWGKIMKFQTAKELLNTTPATNEVVIWGSSK